MHCCLSRLLLLRLLLLLLLPRRLGALGSLHALLGRRSCRCKLLARSLSSGLHQQCTRLLDSLEQFLHQAAIYMAASIRQQYR